jgi:hypothetical protein
MLPQPAGNQAVVRIDGAVLATYPSGRTPGLLGGVLGLLVLVALAHLVELHCCQRSLEAKRQSSIKDFMRDGALNPHAAESDTVTGRLGAERRELAQCGVRAVEFRHHLCSRL